MKCNRGTQHRIAAGVVYDGTDFIGWQSQREGRSVQGEVERALTRVAAAPVAVTAAGRTDAGVHASAQVVHFDTASERSERNWVLGANRHLPPDVAVRWARVVPEGFHARFSAVARAYRYLIYESVVRPVLDRRRCAWVHERLDLAAMQKAAEPLLGEHDFSAFRAAGCQAHSPLRRLDRFELRHEGGILRVEVEANAFLQHMVRNIAGSLILVGRGRKPPAWIGEVLAGRDRRRAGPAAPARGLTLMGIRYPAGFSLPGDYEVSLPDSMQEQTPGL
ncbi:MAG: tRNA pseudouridine(38-40) synthase TruA [Gammaproteobacteria bacterium]